MYIFLGHKVRFSKKIQFTFFKDSKFSTIYFQNVQKSKSTLFLKIISKNLKVKKYAFLNNKICQKVKKSKSTLFFKIKFCQKSKSQKVRFS
jgi:hypothetical protein